MLPLKEESLAAPFDSDALPLSELCGLSLLAPFEASGDELLELLDEASGVLLDEFVEDKLSELVDDGLLTELLELLLLSSVAPWAEDEEDGNVLSAEEDVLRPAWSFSNKRLLLESEVELRLLFGFSLSEALLEASLDELSCEDWLD